MVKLSTCPWHATDARGKTHKYLYLKRRAGSWFFSWKFYTHPQNSPKQLEIQAHARAVTDRWKRITQLARDRWIRYADEHPQSDTFGNVYRLSGYNWWFRCHVQKRRMGNGLYSLPPAVPCPSLPSNLRTEPYTAAIRFIWLAPPGDNVQNYLEIWFTEQPLYHPTQARFERARFEVFHSLGDEIWMFFPPNTGKFTFWFRSASRLTGLRTPWIKREVNFDQ